SDTRTQSPSTHRDSLAHDDGVAHSRPDVHFRSYSRLLLLGLAVLGGVKRALDLDGRDFPSVLAPLLARHRSPQRRAHFLDGLLGAGEGGASLIEKVPEVARLAPVTRACLFRAVVPVASAVARETRVELLDGGSERQKL